MYPGKATTVPSWIKAFDDDRETQARSEGRLTGFPDWRPPRLKQFTLDFYRAFAKRYDEDPRLAFLQTGFGLWGEYHIYDVLKQIGRTFPDKAFQAKFIRQMDECFESTPRMISVDAADGDYSPFEEETELLRADFGLFDDSFLCKPHARENALNWRFFGHERWKASPAGGELSYYTRRDQRLALSPDVPHGRSFEDMATEFHISFMIGNDQPEHQSMKRIQEAGMAIGYRFRVTRFERDASRFVVDVKNEGIAPLYHDAFIAVDGVRSKESLKRLLPGQLLAARVDTAPMVGGKVPRLSIESDHVLPSQTIQFKADLS